MTRFEVRSSIVQRTYRCYFKYIAFSYPVAITVTEVHKGPINAFSSKFVFNGAVGMFYIYEK